jgi:hypothetical protein
VDLYSEEWAERFVILVESGCGTFVLSTRVMCKDLLKLLHDIYTSVLTEWNYESISYKPYLTTRDASVVTCLIRNGQIYTSDL